MPRGRTGDGQTALVTAASAGIGVDLAECFAADGYNLILTARTESALRDVADRLATTYGITADGDLLRCEPFRLLHHFSRRSR